jgi:acyl carrier protein phosphodiesterase
MSFLVDVQQTGLGIHIQEQKFEAIKASPAKFAAVEQLLIANNLLEHLGCAAFIQQVLTFSGGAVFILPC